MILRTAPAATIRVVPEQMQAAMGQDFDVNITISDVKDLFGWEIKLKWNTTLLDVVDVTEGEFLKTKRSFLLSPNQQHRRLRYCRLHILSEHYRSRWTRSVGNREVSRKGARAMCLRSLRDDASQLV
jgi:hypothetical protein